MSAEQTVGPNELRAKLVAKAWRDEGFKKELLEDPKRVLAREIGAEIPDDIDIEVFEESQGKRYLVIPWTGLAKPENLSDEELEMVAGGKCGYTSTRHDPYTEPVTSCSPAVPPC